MFLKNLSSCLSLFSKCVVKLVYHIVIYVAFVRTKSSCKCGWYV